MEKKNSAPIPILSADTVTDTEFWSHTTRPARKEPNAPKQKSIYLRSYCPNIYTVLTGTGRKSANISKKKFLMIGF